MSARLPDILAGATAARRFLLREGVAGTGLLEVEFLDGLPVRRIGPGPTAILPLAAVEGEVHRLRLIMACDELARFEGLELRWQGQPVEAVTTEVPAEFVGLPGVLALEAVVPPVSGEKSAGRLELRLGCTLPHPDNTRLCGPALIAVDRPHQPAPKPEKEVSA